MTAPERAALVALVAALGSPVAARAKARTQTTEQQAWSDGYGRAVGDVLAALAALPSDQTHGGVRPVTAHEGGSTPPASTTTTRLDDTL